jgi:hypothetical protein
MHPQPEFHSTREAAALAGTSFFAVHQMLYRGLLKPPKLRVGGNLIWTAADVERLRAARAVKRPTGRPRKAVAHV